jgi:hypothetical protein
VVHRGFAYFVEGSEAARPFRAALDGAGAEAVGATEAAELNPLGDVLYFSDVSAAAALMASALDGSDAERLIRGRASALVASPVGLFYVNDVREFVRLPLDGGREAVVTANPSSRHCLAAGWVFYENPGDEYSLWMVHPDGSGDRRFDPAAAAS